jgi:uncharacterized protein (DUF2249 family)
MNDLDVEMPPALAAIPPEHVVDVDVRDDLRSGREPFARIMGAKQALPAGHVLCVRAIFEPAPLYRVLGKDGFAHWTERLAEDDWRVWFHRAEEGAPAEDPALADASSPGAEEGVVVLDVRGLEPPEPMVRTLAALETLPPGGTLVQLNVRVPQFLLPKLDEAGFEYEVREQDEELVRVFIRRRGERAGDHHRESEMQKTTGEPMELDVRVIPPREKHPTIFHTFDALQPGESFVLVNDHDPFPLRYQFQAERAGEFGWEYLEQGPAVWRVQISKE